jgi:hypothetical protein
VTPALRIAVFMLAAVPGRAELQDVSAEYRVKAAYLYNFVKFVEWPGDSSSLTICVAGRRVFGTLLEDMVRGEVVGKRRLDAREILEPDEGCHVVFVPEGAAAPAYLRAARGRPILTIGETPAFMAQGGIARFYVDAGNVRFEINPAAAERAGLRISSRLLQLAKIVGSPGTPQ